MNSNRRNGKERLVRVQSVLQQRIVYFLQRATSGSPVAGTTSEQSRIASRLLALIVCPSHETFIPLWLTYMMHLLGATRCQEKGSVVRAEAKL